MNRLTFQERARVLTLLSEGLGINVACRVTRVSKNTVLKLLADVGQACAQYQDQTMRNLTITKVQVDEIRSFNGMTQKNVQVEADPTRGAGDCYTFTAIDPVTKLMFCWFVGFGTSECADQFMTDLAPRLSNRVQLTTNAMNAYPAAVRKAFGDDIDFAVLNKSYDGSIPQVEAKRRYSPTVYVGTTAEIACGWLELRDVSTSHVERANLSMRMGMRRFTRLTDVFSKKIENHMHAISFYAMVYNFVNKHGTIKTTPAIAADVAAIQWTIEDIVLMADTVTFPASN